MLIRERKQIVYDLEVETQTFVRDQLFRDSLNKRVAETLMKACEELHKEYGIKFTLWE